MPSVSLTISINSSVYLGKYEKEIILHCASSIYQGMYLCALTCENFMEMMLWLDSILPAARKLLRSRIKVLTPDLYYLVLVKVSKERIIKKRSFHKSFDTRPLLLSQA